MPDSHFYVKWCGEHVCEVSGPYDICHVLDRVNLIFRLKTTPYNSKPIVLFIGFKVHKRPPWAYAFNAKIGFKKFAPSPKILTKMCQNLVHQTKHSNFCIETVSSSWSFGLPWTLKMERFILSYKGQLCTKIW